MERFVRFKFWVKRRRWLYALASCPCPAPYWDAELRRLTREWGHETRTLDLGSGERKRAPHFINLEIAPVPNVDVVGDGHLLPFADESLDVVIAEAVLEHVRDPSRVAAEIYRTLAPGGVVCAAVPFLQPFHPSPIDLHRWTLEGFESLFSEYEILKSGSCVGPTAALLWVFREWLGLLLSFGNIWIAKAVGWLVGWILSPLLLLDLWLVRRRDARRTAGAVYVIARKRTA